MVKRMAMANTSGQISQLLKVNGKITSFMDMVSTLGLMVANIQAIGSQVR